MECICKRIGYYYINITSIVLIYMLFCFNRKSKAILTISDTMCLTMENQNHNERNTIKNKIILLKIQMTTYELEKFKFIFF